MTTQIVPRMPTIEETGFAAWRDRVMAALAASGIDPATVEVEGLSTEGYYRLGKDYAGRKASVWTPWPSSPARRRMIQALRGEAT